MATEQIRLLIRGHVQGVFYRKFAAEAANTLELKGFVRNLADGRVELVAQGEKEKLLAILQWCHEGSPQA
ncbi:MAG: acylphosphatase, partial [Bdellovibrionota bacterium]